VPVSNYVFGLSMNPPLNQNTYVTQLQYVQGIFNQIYPNWQSGDTQPNPAVAMLTIGNEPDNSGGDITPEEVAQVAQMILYAEDQANIPDGNRMPIAVPLSWAVSYVGTSFNNPTPSVGAVEALYAAFGSTTPFAATAIGNAQVSVPALPSDFFTSRFVWANNPIGNDNAAFLGLQTNPPYAPYNNPACISAPIDWASIPMFFTEDGPSSAQPGNNPTIQVQILQTELSEVQQARTNGQNPNFDGVCVFQWLDQLAHKTGAETGFGIVTFQTGDFQTITDVPPTMDLIDGNPMPNVTWRLDSLVPKPAFNVVKMAFQSRAPLGWENEHLADEATPSLRQALAARAGGALGPHASPTQAARRPERMLRVREAPNGLDPIDRKALALRHLKPLSRSEAAQLLSTSPEVGTKRCFRALKRLGDILATLPGNLEGL
jgi:hypothetical protein